MEQNGNKTMGAYKILFFEKGEGENMEEAKRHFEYFWKTDSCFSQWHPSVFEVDGQKYTCAEQYMMHQKALCFKDEETALKILRSESPKEMKKLGRSVKNWDLYGGTWEATCYDVVKKGNIHKFAQNLEMKAMLFATKGKLLVEASPLDRKWGIGLAADNPLAWNKSTWNGKNLLGYALTEVRDQLQNTD